MGFRILTLKLLPSLLDLIEIRVTRKREKERLKLKAKSEFNLLKKKI